ncbi:MAG: type II toxin-antitoxin system MqsR family toxin, partial [Syntrophales bacterium LBB04]|nr:type II toxin-antitoxin system MqsR family toxin [Syntrophales bacterium LBB04]
LNPTHFYKSMISYSNYTIWQDVYRYQDEYDNHLSIKVQFSVDGQKAVLIQLKRDEWSEE